MGKTALAKVILLIKRASRSVDKKKWMYYILEMEPSCPFISHGVSLDLQTPVMNYFSFTVVTWT